MLILPVRVPKRFRIRLQILNWFAVDLAKELTLLVEGEAVDFTCHSRGGPAVLVESEISATELPAPLRVQVTVARLRCQYFETNGVIADARWLGVCVNWIEVEPVVQWAAGSSL